MSSSDQPLRSTVDPRREAPEYLRDESRLTGEAETLSFPVTEGEMRESLRALTARGTPVTIQGGRTGIAGGAVPHGGHLLNLSRMTRILGLRFPGGDGLPRIRLQPGVVLSDLRRQLASGGQLPAEVGSPADRDRFASGGPWFFPPDPTETSATLGGMVANNASGACSFLYGATRRHVESLRAVLADGSVLTLGRGAPRATGRAFAVRADEGRLIEGRLPDYRMPPVKNAAGYYADEDMDLLDLFIGSEGTLAALSEIEVRLMRAPAAVCGAMAFLPAEEDAVRMVPSLREAAERPAAIEFFDASALDLLRDQKRTNPAFADLPEAPADAQAALYVEYHRDSEAAIEESVLAFAGVLNANGGDDGACWMAAQPHEMERLKRFRHAVPEAVNLRIDQRRKTAPGLTKLGTDMAVPDACLSAVMALYRGGLRDSGLESVVFGHIGDNHLHVNIIPRDPSEYERGRDLYKAWTRDVIRMGGTISAEHGVGKLKVGLLADLYGAAGIDGMRRVKRVFDPAGLLNRGNLFPA